MFFKAFPDEAIKYQTELAAYYDYEEKQREDEEKAIEDFLDKCDKLQLENIILQLLYDGPEWQYNCFIRDYLDI